MLWSAYPGSTLLQIVAFLVLSILAALGCLNVVIVASIGAACDANDDPRDLNEDCRDAYFVDPDAWPDMERELILLEITIISHRWIFIGLLSACTT